MKAYLTFNSQTFEIDFSLPFDISIPLREGENNVNAWYAPPVKMEAVVMGDWVGSVAYGNSVNFRNVFFNPHANGTHTECVGHISKEVFSVNEGLLEFHFFAKLITISPDKIDGDFVITKTQIEKAVKHENCKAIIIRTLPNEAEKINHHYSNTNPPYIKKEAITYLNSIGIEHLLIDLPSVDKEKDEGKLEAHKEFWNFNGELQHHKTITEMIYVPNEIPDGIYFLNLMIAPFQNDASPSKPILYSLKQIDLN